MKNDIKRHGFGIERPACDTVELSGRDREEAARLLALLLGGVERDRGFRDEDLVRIARAIVQDRKNRARIFNPAMFGEPGWDLLLALYSVGQDGARMTIGQLVQVTGLPTTTALRWLNYLGDQGLVRREDHPTDARTAFISLTDKASNAFRLYLSETLTVRL